MLPSLPDIARELGTTTAVINYTVAAFILCMGYVPILWTPLAGFYGRRAVYLMSMPIGILGSIGVGLSHSITGLTTGRIVQAIGEVLLQMCWRLTHTRT